MNSGEIVTASLEALAERVGDPAPQVYARLFAAYPEMEALFVRDTTGAVRGEMLALTFECLLDIGGQPIRVRIQFLPQHGIQGNISPPMRKSCR